MQNLPHSVGQTKRTISPPLGAGKSTKLPAHLRQVKQLSLTRLFSAESLGFPRSREEERALCLPKEQGRVCTLPCLREGSFTLQDGAHFWSLHPPPALNISSPISGMFAISQNSFMPDFISLAFCYVCEHGNIFYSLCLCNEEPFTLDFDKSHLLQRVDTYLIMANMIFPYQLILHDLHRYELTQHWPFVTSVNMVTYFIHCVFVMKNLSHSTSANRIFSNVSILTSVDQ
ncbi:hypothetical protein T01_2901 [Trichinella spiralis]|uniref:Uncharacterized protein n=1 Tax=Trichinella spiralis TaxID=6334 RepID=A0A0V1BIW8_TRISP|nr:hypothetical protein T01_2901 [Trichinella spiralis]